MCGGSLFGDTDCMLLGGSPGIRIGRYRSSHSLILLARRRVISRYMHAVDMLLHSSYDDVYNLKNIIIKIKIGYFRLLHTTDRMLCDKLRLNDDKSGLLDITSPRSNQCVCVCVCMCVCARVCLCFRRVE